MKHLVYLIISDQDGTKSTAVTIQSTHPAKHDQPLAIRYMPKSELIVLKKQFHGIVHALATA